MTDPDLALPAGYATFLEDLEPGAARRGNLCPLDMLGRGLPQRVR